jgi:hypothetical protein
MAVDRNHPKSMPSPVAMPAEPRFAQRVRELSSPLDAIQLGCQTNPP